MCALIYKFTSASHMIRDGSGGVIQGGFLWEDGMRGFLSEVVGYECATGPKA